MFARMQVRKLCSAGRRGEAKAIIEQLAPSHTETVETRVTKADLLVDAGYVMESDAIFQALIAEYPRREDVRETFVRIAFSRGHLGTASAFLGELSKSTDSGKKIAAAVQQSVEAYTRFTGKAPPVFEDNRPTVIEAALKKFANREMPKLRPLEKKKAVLLIGNLCAGGAERQFALCAKELHGRESEVGEVNISTLTPMTQGNDFYLPILSEAGIDVTEVEKLPRNRNLGADILGADYVVLQNILQVGFRDGIQRFGNWLQELKPDVVSVWLDHLFFMALAALIEGVPEIYLNIRGESPEERGHAAAPKYRSIYLTLASIPGIKFHCNSYSVAESYSRWLGLPEETFEVIPNGATMPLFEPTDEEEEKWQAFNEATKNAEFTIGTVARFDPGKRLDFWLDCASKFLERHPSARFVIVGYGAMDDHLEALAESLGLRDRILFAGRSSNVGFWLEKMDAFLFTSISEGMPNVLVESQYAGIPVVSTKAGDAERTFIDGVTGRTIESLESPDPDEAVRYLEDVISEFRADPSLANRARTHAENFTPKRMGNRYFDSLFGTELDE